MISALQICHSCTQWERILVVYGNLQVKIMIMLLILALSCEMTVIRQAQPHEKNTNVEVKIPQFNFFLLFVKCFMCICVFFFNCAFFLILCIYNAPCFIYRVQLL